MTVSLVQARTAEAWAALGVVCPSCRGALGESGATALRCEVCGASWPVVCGIPDLRTLGDPYLSVAADVEAAQALVARDDGRDFGALYASYYDGNAKVPPEQVARFTHGVLAAFDRAAGTIAAWGDLGVTLSPTGLVVDIGCGTAPLATQLAATGHRVLGLDAGLRWLVLARKRAAARGIDLPVVCANVERLPLRDAAASAVVGESVLENLHDAEAGLAEARRVLVAGGAVALTTPNRTSLGPDPHLGLLAGGWRAESTVRAYAARTGQVMPRRRLFSPAELSAALQLHGFREPRLALPRFVAAQTAGLSLPVRLGIAGYHIARRVPVVRSLVLHIAPTLVVTAHHA